MDKTNEDRIGALRSELTKTTTHNESLKAEVERLEAENRERITELADLKALYTWEVVGQMMKSRKDAHE